MKFASAHYPLYESNATRRIGMVLGLVVLVMAVSQLFEFEGLASIFTAFWATTTHDGTLIAALVVTAEVFSLPFLLGMRLSVAMRLLSALLLLCVSAYWAAAAVVGALVVSGIESGLFGGALVVETGFWFQLFAVLFVAVTTVYFAQVYLDSHRLHQHLRKSAR